MTSARRPFHLLRNSMFAGMTGASNILFLLLFLLVARYRGAEALGNIALGIAVANAVAFGLNMGVNSVAIRRIATDPESATRTASQLMLCRLGISAVGTALLLPLLALAFDDPLQRSMVLLFALSGVLRSINMSSRALLQSIDRFASEAAVVFADAAAILVIGWGVLHFGGGEIALAQVFVVVRALIAIGYMIATPRLFPGLRWQFDAELSKWLLRTGLPLGIAIALSALYWQLDILMVSVWSTPLVTGLFGAAFRMVEGLRVAPDTLGAAFYPRLATSGAGDLEAFDEVFARGCRYLLIAAAAAAVAMATFGPQIVRLLYGADFTRAGYVLAALAAVPAMLFLATFAFVGLRALGRESLVMYVMVLAVGAKLLLGFLLIRRYGAHGATLTAIAGSLVLLAGVLAALWRVRGSLLGIPGVAARLLVCAGISIAAGLVLRDHSLTAAIAGSLLLFGAGLIWLRMFDATEIGWARHQLRKLGGTTG